VARFHHGGGYRPGNYGSAGSNANLGRLKSFLTRFYFCEFCGKEFFNTHGRIATAPNPTVLSANVPDDDTLVSQVKTPN
jgi:hypothetical protein